MVLDLLNNPLALFFLVVVVVAAGALHIYRHDSPALVVDAALMAVAIIWFRSVPAALFVSLIYVLRWHWSPLTDAERQLARDWSWALPGAARKASSRGCHAPATGATTALPSVVLPEAAASVAQAAPQAPAVLRPERWLVMLNDDPTAPHIGLIGPSRFGKSTMAKAVVGRRRGRIAIATPKSREEDDWDGAQAARLEIDLKTRTISYQQIVNLIGGVHFEMLRRKVQGDTRAEPISLVVDDYNVIAPNVPVQTRRQIIEIWSIGASSGIRTLFIATEINARAWGIEGRRDVTDNILFAKVEGDRVWSAGRIDTNGRLIAPQVLDTRGVTTLASQARIAGREWCPAPPTTPTGSLMDPAAQAALAALLDEPLGPSEGVVGVGVGAKPSDLDGRTDGRTPDLDRIVALAKAIKQGETRDSLRDKGQAYANDDYKVANMLVKSKVI